MSGMPAGIYDVHGVAPMSQVQCEWLQVRLAGLDGAAGQKTAQDEQEYRARPE